MEAFTYTLSFLQTMPRFLDLAFTFGRQEGVKDFHYTAFNSENFLDKPDAQKHGIPRLGRSGHEIRYCFNLWAVEKSESPAWSIRQTAVYHSFDVCTGRAAWINIKGNQLMEERITQALSSTNQLRPSSLKTVGEAFSASLLTLLIVLEWSGGDWKSRISDLQNQLSDILMKAKNAPIKSIEEALSLDPNVLLQNLKATQEDAGRTLSRVDSTVYSKSPRRADTFQSVLSSISPKRIFSGFSRDSTALEADQPGSPVLTKANTPQSRPKLPPLLTSPTLLQQARLDSVTGGQGNFNVLQEFTVDGLQKLTDVASKIHEAKLVMRLNAEVINEVIDYYQVLAECDEMPMDIRHNCAADLKSFVRRARAIIRSLDMEQSRLDTLMRMFEDGKSLVSVAHILCMTWNALIAYNFIKSLTI
jgi:flagellar hook-basal body complex protein FliE